MLIKVCDKDGCVDEHEVSADFKEKFQKLVKLEAQLEFMNLDNKPLKLDLNKA